jgi:hypothetical protein
MGEDDENITVWLKDFKPYPIGNILAILDATGEQVLIVVAEYLPEERRAALVEDLKMMWRALVGNSHNTVILIRIKDIRAKQDLELEKDY